MKKPIIALLHIGYWMLYSSLLLLLLFMLNNGAVWNNRQLALFLPLFIYVPALIGFYTFYTFLFSRFLVRKKIPALLLTGVLTSLLAGIAGISIVWIIWKHRLPYKEQTTAIIAFIVMMAINALLNGLVGLVMRAFISWYNDIRWKETLARRNAEMELALVKAQINPHFLFNTLNNIDVLIEKDPAQASDYFKKLSGILRFMLYETRAEQISLSDELAYIEKYIHLQKIRSSRPGYVHYSVEGAVGNIQVAPMLFIPFIENAFKHADTKKQDNAIVVKFDMREREIVFHCSNRYMPHMQKQETNEGGLGNNLIQKRLQLLYPGKHQLNIQTGNQLYTVHLKLSV
ncbi:Histidine kinase [Filimonas lacunae]|uniref:Histidine kinase n=1 Tax=Filimonas lacunae TaxID=477680 RepID=A0A173MPT7_9BACT|nr:histidine kinase [Filimonas lacunae]BAV09705.1 two-component system sensor protein, no kinase domain [Filimonas lacunae]SIS77553.1 Histidine kinase [Filimonas lacunae]